MVQKQEENEDQGPVSGKILRLETDLNSLITMVTIVFSMLKINRGLKIFLRNWLQNRNTNDFIMN